MKEKISCIYEIRNTQNNRVYVGSAVDFEDRKRVHLYDLRRSQHHSWKLQKDFDLQEESDFVFSILESVSGGKGTMVEREQFWMDSTAPYYNINPKAHSALGYKHTEDAKKRMSILCSGWKHTPETVEICRKAATGQRHTQEAKDLMSAKRKGKPMHDNTRKALNKYFLGKTLPDEWRANISKGRTGCKVSEEGIKSLSKAFKGRVISEECKARISSANSFPVVQLTLLLSLLLLRKHVSFLNATESLYKIAVEEVRSLLEVSSLFTKRIIYDSGIQASEQAVVLRLQQ